MDSNNIKVNKEGIGFFKNILPYNKTVRGCFYGYDKCHIWFHK